MHRFIGIFFAGYPSLVEVINSRVRSHWESGRDRLKRTSRLVSWSDTGALLHRLVSSLTLIADELIRAESGNGVVGRHRLPGRNSGGIRLQPG